MSPRPRRKAAEVAIQKNAKVLGGRLPPVIRKAAPATETSQRHPEGVDAAPYESPRSHTQDEVAEMFESSEVDVDAPEPHRIQHRADQLTDSEDEYIEMKRPPKKRFRFTNAEDEDEDEDGEDEAAGDGSRASMMTQGSFTSTEPASSASANPFSLVASWAAAIDPGVPASGGSGPRSVFTNAQISPNAGVTAAVSEGHVASSDAQPLVDPSDLSTNKKAGRAAKVSDLPVAAYANDAWTRKFLPTLFRYLGTRSDPWYWHKSFAVPTLQAIWAAVYGEELPYPIAASDKVLALATQRLRLWRNTFSTIAMHTLESFFQSRPEIFDTLRARAQYCEKVIKDGRLFYADPDGESKTGLFQSHFVLVPLAHHIKAVQGAVSTPGLCDVGSEECPFGAIGLAGAAVYRVALLYRLRRIAIAGDGQVSITKSVNPVTGAASYHDTNFSALNYRVKTVQCASSASKLSSENLDQLLEIAHLRAHVPRVPGRQTPLVIDDDGLALDYSELVEGD